MQIADVRWCRVYTWAFTEVWGPEVKLPNLGLIQITTVNLSSRVQYRKEGSSRQRGNTALFYFAVTTDFESAVTLIKRQDLFVLEFSTTGYTGCTVHPRKFAREGKYHRLAEVGGFSTLNTSPFGTTQRRDLFRSRKRNLGPKWIHDIYIAPVMECKYSHCSGSSFSFFANLAYSSRCQRI